MRQEVTAELTSEALSKRVLALVDSIQSREDISPRSFEQFMRMPVTFSKTLPDKYGYAGKLGGGWRYELKALSPDPQRPSSRFNFDFHQVDRDYSDVSPICTPDYAGYARALEAMGFSYDGKIDQYGFTRDYYARGKARISLARLMSNMNLPGSACLRELYVNVID